MTNYLLRVIASQPIALWVPVFAIGYAIGMALAINQRAKDLAADAKKALTRDEATVDYAARCAAMPPCKLSDQLRGVSPFTALWRLLSVDELAASDFEVEFLGLRAKRHGLTLVRSDVGALLARLDEALSGQKPMVKASLTGAMRDSEREVV